MRESRDSNPAINQVVGIAMFGEISVCLGTKPWEYNVLSS